MKTIVLQDDLHGEVKFLALINNITIQEYINNAVKRAVRNDKRKIDKTC